MKVDLLTFWTDKTNILPGFLLPEDEFFNVFFNISCRSFNTVLSVTLTPYSFMCVRAVAPDQGALQILPVIGAECMCYENIVISKFDSFSWHDASINY